MANTVTQINSAAGLPVSYFGARVVPLRVTIDTVNTDIPLITPDANEYTCVLGMVYGLALAHDLLWKSGNTNQIVTLVNPASTRVAERVGGGVLLSTMNKGDILTLQSSVVIPNMLIHVGFFKEIPIR
jgi:hypothetical protein